MSPGVVRAKFNNGHGDPSDGSEKMKQNGRGALRTGELQCGAAGPGSDGERQSAGRWASLAPDKQPQEAEPLCHSVRFTWAPSSPVSGHLGIWLKCRSRLSSCQVGLSSGIPTPLRDAVLPVGDHILSLKPG